MMYQDKIMFEIYQDNTYSKEFRVVYFSELNDHNRDKEIDRAMLGDHYYDGFFLTLKKERAMRDIDRVVDRLNTGNDFNLDDLKTELSEILID
jgi:cobyrinic acid a,c-diamide synthase